jgi:hypothetical protein
LSYGCWQIGRSKHDVPEVPLADAIFDLVFGGSFGALVGALGAPLLGWCFFRHVPLGRAMVITSIGTIDGALVGLVAGRDPVIAGVLGFAITGAALRYHPRAG